MFTILLCKKNGLGFLSTPVSSHPSEDEARRIKEEAFKTLKEGEWLEVTGESEIKEEASF